MTIMDTRPAESLSMVEPCEAGVEVDEDEFVLI